MTDQLDGSARRIRDMEQLEGPDGQTSDLFLRFWPVCIFENQPFSLYIVAASESYEGLVVFGTLGHFE